MRMGRDGKPVPYNAVFVGPSNPQLVSVLTKVDNRIDNYGSAQRRLDVSNFPEMGPGYAGNLSKHRETLNTLADSIRAGNQKEQTHAG